MNLEICRQCEQKRCMIFMKKVDGKCIADIFPYVIFSQGESYSAENNMYTGVCMGVRIATSDFFAEKRDGKMTLREVPRRSGIMKYEDEPFRYQKKEIGNSWDFDEYVPENDSESLCRYWTEQVVASMQGKENK